MGRLGDGEIEGWGDEFLSFSVISLPFSPLSLSPPLTSLEFFHDNGPVLGRGFDSMNQ